MIHYSLRDNKSKNWMSPKQRTKNSILILINRRSAMIKLPMLCLLYTSFFWMETMKDEFVRIVQLSDIHLFENPEDSLLGVKTQESFAALLEMLKKEEFSFIILSGDLSQDGSDASYLRIAKMLKPFQVPIYCIPGNHDNTKIMARVYPVENISNHRHIVLKNWHIILLNSQIPGSVEGYLDRSQLHYLEHCLQTYPEHHAIIVFHHHPIPVGSAWLDKLGLTNANEFWQLTENYPMITAVLFGHVHMAVEGKVKNIPYYSTPAGCIQFKPHHDAFSLDHIPQGFRIIELYSNGKLKTEVKRLPKYIGHFDQGAKGY